MSDADSSTSDSRLLDSSPPHPIGPGGADQAFLVGEGIYLSPIEIADAATAMFWRPVLFPQPTDVVEDKLKEQLPAAAELGTRTLIARRRGDDRPTGSVAIESRDGRWAAVTLHVPPVFGERVVSEVSAEMIGLIIPWLVHENDHMVVWLTMPSGDEGTVRAVEAAGMRRTFRFREAKIVGGRRHDLLGYQVLHPAWVATLGEPEIAAEGPVERETRHPAPRTYARRDQDPPRNAVMVGDRVYLRPLEEADRELMARWSMRETDPSHDQGRSVRSPISSSHFNRKLAEPEPAEWTRFAIVTVDADEVIGANGLADIDWIHKTAETETEIVRPAFRGGGYGSEAKHLLLEYGFDILGLHMVFSGAWAFNLRSCAALRKQGYRDAGGESWSGFKDGKMADDAYFDLLASEWRAARDNGA